MIVLTAAREGEHSVVADIVSSHAKTGEKSKSLVDRVVAMDPSIGRGAGLATRRSKANPKAPTAVSRMSAEPPMARAMEYRAQSRSRRADVQTVETLGLSDPRRMWQALEDGRWQSFAFGPHDERPRDGPVRSRRPPPCRMVTAPRCRTPPSPACPAHALTHPAACRERRAQSRPKPERLR